MEWSNSDIVEYEMPYYCLKSKKLPENVRNKQGYLFCCGCTLFASAMFSIFLYFSMFSMLACRECPHYSNFTSIKRHRYYRNPTDEYSYTQCTYESKYLETNLTSNEMYRVTLEIEKETSNLPFNRKCQNIVIISVTVGQALICLCLLHLSFGCIYADRYVSEEDEAIKKSQTQLECYVIALCGSFYFIYHCIEFTIKYLCPCYLSHKSLVVQVTTTNNRIVGFYTKEIIKELVSEETLLLPSSQEDETKQEI